MRFRLQAKLLKLPTNDRGIADVVDECVHALTGLPDLFQIGEPESCGAKEDRRASLVATGSGSGFATGPSQHVSIFALQSRQIVDPPTRKSETL